jgi:hypothetical protein
MAKLKSDLFGVKAGEIHPATIPAGEECPPELLEAALELGAVDEKEGKAALEKHMKAVGAAAAKAAKEAAETEE